MNGNDTILGRLSGRTHFRFSGNGLTVAMPVVMLFAGAGQGAELDPDDRGFVALRTSAGLDT